MITDQSLKLIQLQAETLSKLGVLPFRWDPLKETYFWKETRKKSCFLFWLCALLHVGLAGSHLLSCFRSTFLSSRIPCSSLDQSLTHYNLVLLSTILIIYSLFAFTHPRTIVEVHNSFDVFVRHVKLDRNFLPRRFEKSKYFKGIDNLILGLVVGLNLFGILISGQTWIFHRLKLFPTGFVQLEGARLDLILIKIYLQLAYSYFMVCSFLLISFLLTFVVSGMVMFTTLIGQEFKLGLNRDIYITRGNVRYTSNLIRHYRGVELMIRLNLDCYAALIIPGETLLSIAVVHSTCCLILYGKMFEIILLFTFVSGWTFSLAVLLILFEIGGRFEKLSKETLHSWKKHRTILEGNYNGQPYFRRFARSCRPLCFCYKGYRKIRRDTILILLRTLARNTFRALAAFQR